MEGDEGEEEKRREAALAGTPLLQAGFRSSKVSQAQLDKFRVLYSFPTPLVALPLCSG